jgi:hypothetical protein
MGYTTPLTHAANLKAFALVPTPDTETPAPEGAAPAQPKTYPEYRAMPVDRPPTPRDTPPSPTSRQYCDDQGRPLPDF